MKITNPLLVRILGPALGVEKHEAKFPFHIVRYNNDLLRSEFFEEALIKWNQHDKNVREGLKECIKLCKEDEKEFLTDK